jgi:hypothetical protein
MCLRDLCKRLHAFCHPSHQMHTATCTQISCHYLNTRWDELQNETPNDPFHQSLSAKRKPLSLKRCATLAMSARMPKIMLHACMRVLTLQNTLVGLQGASAEDVITHVTEGLHRRALGGIAREELEHWRAKRAQLPHRLWVCSLSLPRQILMPQQLRHDLHARSRTVTCMHSNTTALSATTTTKTRPFYVSLHNMLYHSP